MSIWIILMMVDVHQLGHDHVISVEKVLTLTIIPGLAYQDTNNSLLITIKGSRNSKIKTRKNGRNSRIKTSKNGRIKSNVLTI